MAAARLYLFMPLRRASSGGALSASARNVPVHISGRHVLWARPQVGGHNRFGLVTRCYMLTALCAWLAGGGLRI